MGNSGATVHPIEMSLTKCHLDRDLNKDFKDSDLRESSSRKMSTAQEASGVSLGQVRVVKKILEYGTQ